MASQPKLLLSPEEYLSMERVATQKSEYFRGEVFAMSGASPAHVLIVSNIVAALHGQLRGGPCRVYSTDLRVKVQASGLFTYPDVIVICGEMLFDDDRKDTALNPTLIIEVLSPSTKDYDRGEKFEQYRKIPSFVEYVLVAQDHCHVEHFVKQPDGDWLLSETNCITDDVHTPSIACTLSLTDMYENVQVDAV